MSQITSISQLDLHATYSYADYVMWRFEEMVELIKGKIFKMSAPTSTHQIISTNLTFLFKRFLYHSPCKVIHAPLDVFFKNGNDNEIDTVVQPDIVVVCDGSKIEKKGCVGVPDLVIEILSNSTRSKDLEIKKNLYQEHKVKEYWIIEPEEQWVDQYILENDVFCEPKRYRGLTSNIEVELFKGWNIQLNDIFRD
jgi:Uma2 family endonuclease